MSPNTILALQAFLVFLQMLNVGLVTIPQVPPFYFVLISAVIGGFQTFLQHVGNQVQPLGSLSNPVVQSGPETPGK